MKKKLISIPAYNEENNIVATIGKIRKYCSPREYDVVVIDDGSKDKTRDRVLMAGEIVICHPYNMGYGVAIQTGYKYALENGYQLLAQIDADGQHDPRYIKKMIKMLTTDNLDLVVGSRFKRNTGYKAPWVRKIGMLMFSKIVSLVTGRKVTDSTSGYQVMNNKVMRFLTNDQFPCDYPDADLLIMLHFAGYKVDEIAMKMYENREGKSMHGSILKNFYYVAKMSLSIFTILLRKVSGLQVV